MKKWYSGILPTLALFGSISTLLCCALPALLVSIGAGAVMVGLVSAVPQLIVLSEHKIALFLIAGVLLLLSAFGTYAARNAPCPIDPREAEACQRLRRVSRGVLYFSCAVYAVGFFFAFVAKYLV